MPVPSPAFRQAVKQLSDKEKEALILKAVRRDAELYELLSYELLEEVTLEEVYAQSAEKIDELLVQTSGRNLPKALVRALRKVLKEIARFKRITKNAKAEVDLHLHALQLLFRHYVTHFDNYHYQGLYTATARLVLRTMQLIHKNLHEDYHLEYKADLDDLLQKLHCVQRPLPVALPKAFA